MPTLAIERLFKIAQYPNIFIDRVGLDHCRKIAIRFLTLACLRQQYGGYSRQRLCPDVSVFDQSDQNPVGSINSYVRQAHARLMSW